MPTLDSTDYYGLCQTGVMTLLRSLSYFSTQPLIQVSANRFNVNKGYDYFAVFLPSLFNNQKLDPHNRRITWMMLFDLYVRYTTAEEATNKFLAVRSAIFNQIGIYPTLNGVRGVEEVGLAAQTELLQDMPGDNPNFVIQTMRVSVSQRITFIF